MMPPLVPLNNHIHSILKIMKEEVVRHRATASTSPKCGEAISQRHYRYIIAHTRPGMIYRWIQHIFSDFIEFVNIQNSSNNRTPDSSIVN